MVICARKQFEELTIPTDVRYYAGDQTISTYLIHRFKDLLLDGIA